MVPRTRLELVQRQAPRDFKSLASTNSATQALEIKFDAYYTIKKEKSKSFSQPSTLKPLIDGWSIQLSA
jgi:hypothetical protein